ncbi:hypothetical protein GDO81_002163 [Engystomops pustulosus]|uniref:Uncharacterized protein n=1 Tax=Engystomops pustulosus TaxID=76066 RepID=A0AAV7DIS4_ENGPU|nr:hypothetical protein GDO81_002163 [Engystomops pustulosus]
MMGLPFLTSRFLPLWDHPDFMHGRDNPAFKIWQEKGIRTAADLFHSTEPRLLTFQKLAVNHQLGSGHYLALCQINRFLQDRLGDWTKEWKCTFLDSALTSTPNVYSISFLYPQLHSVEVDKKKQPLCLRCGRRIQGVLTLHRWYLKVGRDLGKQ